MSSIIPLLSGKINKTKKLLETPCIKDKALEYLKAKPFKNIKKTITSNRFNFDLEDLEYHLTFISESGEKIYVPIVMLYWKLNYDNNINVKYKLVIEEKLKAGRCHMETIFQGLEYFNLILNYQYLTNAFESNDICMYSFSLNPEKDEETGVLTLDDTTLISFEIEGLEINEQNPLEIDIVVQYWCPNFKQIILNHCIIPLYSYTNFMQVLGQTKNINLLSKNSLKDSFGKLDHHLIVNICEYIL